MLAATIVRASDDWGEHMGRGWWWLMGIGWLIFLAVLVVLAVVLIRHYRPTEPSRRAARDILDERFVRGEIDEDEYHRRRDALGS
jgi:putative membrane protein